MVVCYWESLDKLSNHKDWSQQIWGLCPKEVLLVIISQIGSLNGKIDAYRLNMFFFVVYNEVKTTKNLVLMGLYIYIPRYSFSGYIYIFILQVDLGIYIYIILVYRWWDLWWASESKPRLGKSSNQMRLATIWWQWSLYIDKFDNHR